MSEVLHQKANNGEENGFSRRRVMAGVAWSVPVIVTAIGVPPASASTGPISATAAWLPGANPQYFKIGGGGAKYDGTGPASLSLKNTGASGFTGTVSVTITLSPVGTVLVGIGVESLLPAAVSAPSDFRQHASTTSFSFSGTIASGQTTNFPIRFNYESIHPKPSKTTYSYAMTTTVTMTANGRGSLSLAPTTPNPTITF